MVRLEGFKPPTTQIITLIALSLSYKRMEPGAGLEPASPLISECSSQLSYPGRNIKLSEKWSERPGGSPGPPRQRALVCTITPPLKKCYLANGKLLSTFFIAFRSVVGARPIAISWLG